MDLTAVIPILKRNVYTLPLTGATLMHLTFKVVQTIRQAAAAARI